MVPQSMLYATSCSRTTSRTIFVSPRIILLLCFPLVLAFDIFQLVLHNRFQAFIPSSEEENVVRLDGAASGMSSKGF